MNTSIQDCRWDRKEKVNHQSSGTVAQALDFHWLPSINNLTLCHVRALFWSYQTIFFGKYFQSISKHHWFHSLWFRIKNSMTVLHQRFLPDVTLNFFFLPEPKLCLQSVDDFPQIVDNLFCELLTLLLLLCRLQICWALYQKRRHYESTGWWFLWLLSWGWNASSLLSSKIRNRRILGLILALIFYLPFLVTEAKWWWLGWLINQTCLLLGPLGSYFALQKPQVWFPLDGPCRTDNLLKQLTFHWIIYSQH